MSGRTFSFTRNSPLRTTLIDEATGHAMYEIDTPRKFSASYVTKIRKLDPAIRPPPYEFGDDDSDADEGPADKKRAPVGVEGDESVIELPETGSNEMARIYWNFVARDKIVFRGKITTRSEFLPECGKMRGSYKFTGPDGVEYRWAMGVAGVNYPRLVTMDEEKTELAKFHRAHHFTKRQKARLEVQPAGMGMLDHIVLTFVVVECNRRERERGANGSGTVVFD